MYARTRSIYYERTSKSAFARVALCKVGTQVVQISRGHVERADGVERCVECGWRGGPSWRGTHGGEGHGIVGHAMHGLEGLARRMAWHGEEEEEERGGMASRQATCLRRVSFRWQFGGLHPPPIFIPSPYGIMLFLKRICGGKKKK